MLQKLLVCRTIVARSTKHRLSTYSIMANQTTVSPAQPTAKTQFYRRELPKTCISFSSAEGKKIFAEALSLGHMECYFKLAAQFRTQDEPAFCGLTTMVMVLNALSIDPGIVWKGPWRWYHENMLDCCIPLQLIEQEVSLKKFGDCSFWDQMRRSCTSLTEKTHFYRRELPKACISFSSTEGKQIFAEALALGYMECYFNLAAQFRTQDEPAFCGLSTLVMVLNTLGIDPGFVWKAPWRWFHETMLDCCVSQHVIEQQGINFEQFECLAKCNSLSVETTRVDESASEDDFRNTVKKYTQMEEPYMVLSYSRKVLQQTGDGHFSPVGGYHPGRDLVLILDTARFKYPPHWVSLPLLWEAMKALDMLTGQPRGYMVLSRYDYRKGLVLFRIASGFSISMPMAMTLDTFDFFKTWRLWLQTEPQELNYQGCLDDETGGDGGSNSSQQDHEGLIKTSVNHLFDAAETLHDTRTIFTTQIDIDCLNCLSPEHGCIVLDLLNKLEQTKMYSYVQKALAEVEDKFKPNIKKFGQFASIETPSHDSQDGSPSKKCKLTGKVSPAHFVSMFLLSWPYTEMETDNANSYAQRLMGFVAKDVKDKLVAMESQTLHQQLSVLIDLSKRHQPQKCCAAAQSCKSVQ